MNYRMTVYPVNNWCLGKCIQASNSGEWKGEKNVTTNLELINFSYLDVGWAVMEAFRLILTSQ